MIFWKEKFAFRGSFCLAPTSALLFEAEIRVVSSSPVITAWVWEMVWIGVFAGIVWGTCSGAQVCPW